MKNDITLENILKIYEEEISKNVKNKNRLYKYECNKIEKSIDILNNLKKGIIGNIRYNIFLIYEPKCRLVMSLSVKDKIVNHFITRYYLEKNLNKYLDIRNCATRKNMGTDRALKLLIKYLEINKRKNNTFYVLKIDIKKYFYNIDHEILKKLLKDKLDNFTYNLITQVIDTTNHKYINERINELKEKNNIDIPTYEYGKGLPIGNMTSQFLSIFYLSELDHFIVHDLKLKYYIRYMDDFLIISHDLEKLKQAKEIIKDKLLKEYKLAVNDKKTMIINPKNSFSYLGYTFKIINNKTIIRVNRSKVERIKRRIKEVKWKLNHNLISHNSAFASIMTYKYSYKYSKNNTKILNIIDKYFYEK